MEKLISEKNWVRGSCIGRGAYGTVYLGVDVSSGAVFAVKSVDLASSSGGGRGSPSQAAAAEAALEDEIRILKSLSSPFIVKYLGDDTSSYRRNLHMEYMPAGTAADLAAAAKSTTGFFDEAAVASYTWCLVSALSYLHSRGIVHCDVKGKNVLLGHSPGSAKLADFGSAVEISSPAAAAISTRGSPLWMAPEVIRGERQGTESDVWSLGCTVIEMVTGKPAWGDGGAHSVCRIGYSDELPQFPAELSRLGHDFLDKCLRRDYTERWSCDQLLHHPFVTVNSQKYSIDYSSPRCVLEDWFGSDFHDEDEDEEEEDEEVKNLGESERLRELVSDSGANWEYSNGWITVRCQSEDGERTFSEYSAPIRRTNSNSSLVPLSEEQIYSHPNDVVYEPQRFNCDRKVVSVALPCSLVKRIYKCNNFIFLADLYTCPCFTSSIFSQKNTNKTTLFSTMGRDELHGY
ncbi:hypothetical protein ABFS83_04G084300 [Erythranthe nasuta]